jgi:ankyrin repeat protein
MICLAAGLAAPAAAAARAALADAMEHRDSAGVRTLLDTGADVNAAQADGTTALHWAAYYDDLEMVTLLVRAGVPSAKARKETWMLWVNSQVANAACSSTDAACASASCCARRMGSRLR